MYTYTVTMQQMYKGMFRAVGQANTNFGAAAYMIWPMFSCSKALAIHMLDEVTSMTTKLQQMMKFWCVTYRAIIKTGMLT